MNTCPLCGAVLIPRYSFCEVEKGYKNMLLQKVCPNCIPPEEA